MCEAFSCLVTRRKSVIWKAGIDSHDELFSKFKEQKRLVDDGITRKNFVQVEITPDEGYLRPEKGWTFRIDDVMSNWFTPAHEKACFKTLEEWKKEVYSKINLKEALNPFNPFAKERKRVTKKELLLLKQWASVGYSVKASVGYSVKASVKASVGYSVWDSVWDSVRDSVGYSVGYSVKASVKASVGYSVWDSVWAYYGSFFKGIEKWKDIKHKKGIYPFQSIEKWKDIKHKKGIYPFQSAVDLWYKGLVPSFDGEIWRLHTGKNAKVIWQGTIDDIK